jgi:hypothetical protein
MHEYFSKIGDTLINEELPAGGSGITFFIDKEPVIKLEKDAFWYKGKKVKDVNQVYERFSEWMATAFKTEAEDSQVKGAVPEEYASKDQCGPDSGASRIVRSGSWYGDFEGCRSAYRNWSDPKNRYVCNGFRSVRAFS